MVELSLSWIISIYYEIKVFFFFFSLLMIHASVVTDGLNLFSTNDLTQAALPQRSGGLYKTTLRLITVPKKNNKTFVPNKNKPNQKSKKCSQ